MDPLLSAQHGIRAGKRAWCDDPVRQCSGTTRSRLCLGYYDDVHQFDRITMDPEIK
jgi:hypothetical protein